MHWDRRYYKLQTTSNKIKSHMEKQTEDNLQTDFPSFIPFVPLSHFLLSVIILPRLVQIRTTEKTPALPSTFFQRCTTTEPGLTWVEEPKVIVGRHYFATTASDHISATTTYAVWDDENRTPKSTPFQAWVCVYINGIRNDYITNTFEISKTHFDTLHLAQIACVNEQVISLAKLSLATTATNQ
jgi:hypothetical protein